MKLTKKLWNKYDAKIWISDRHVMGFESTFYLGDILSYVSMVVDLDCLYFRTELAKLCSTSFYTSKFNYSKIWNNTTIEPGYQPFDNFLSAFH